MTAPTSRVIALVVLVFALALLAAPRGRSGVPALAAAQALPDLPQAFANPSPSPSASLAVAADAPDSADAATSASPTPAPSESASPSVSASPSASASISPSASVTPSALPSVTPLPSRAPPAPNASQTPFPTPSTTRTPSPTPSATRSPSPTPSATRTPTPTPSPSRGAAVAGGGGDTTGTSTADGTGTGDTDTATGSTTAPTTTAASADTGSDTAATPAPPPRVTGVCRRELLPPSPILGRSPLHNAACVLLSAVAISLASLLYRAGLDWQRRARVLALRAVCIVLARLLLLLAIKTSAALVATITKVQGDDDVAFDASSAFLTWGSAVFIRLYYEGVRMAFGVLTHTAGAPSVAAPLRAYLDFESDPHPLDAEAGSAIPGAPVGMIRSSTLRSSGLRGTGESDCDHISAEDGSDNGHDGETRHNADADFAAPLPATPSARRALGFADPFSAASSTTSDDDGSPQPAPTLRDFLWRGRRDRVLILAMSLLFCFFEVLILGLNAGDLFSSLRPADENARNGMIFMPDTGTGQCGGFVSSDVPFLVPLFSLHAVYWLTNQASIIPLLIAGADRLQSRRMTTGVLALLVLWTGSLLAMPAFATALAPVFRTGDITLFWYIILAPPAYTQPAYIILAVYTVLASGATVFVLLRMKRTAKTT